MKQYLKKLFSIAVLFSTTALIADAAVAPYLEFRSVSRNTDRKLVGTTSYGVYLYDMESFYGTFNITPGYERSFRPNAIARQLFGSSLVPNPTSTSTTTTTSSNSNHNNTLVISGPLSVNRTAATDWDAENFLLPLDFKSTITFKPVLQNIFVDFNLYVGLDEWVKGMYFRLYGPVVNNRTRLTPEETIVNEGTSGYNAGLISTVDIPTSSLFTEALQFFNGNALPGTLANATFTPLAFAKINNSTHRKTGFADLRGEFGWNYITEDYHVGINIQAAAPTGTRPKAEYLFEPQVGNGKHWELGVGLMGGWTLWRCSEDPDDKYFTFLVEADITHMFKAKQKRTFDLVGVSPATNNPDSRYLLAQQLRTPIAPAAVTPTGGFLPMTGLGATANLEFAGVFQPVANISTRDCKVSVGVQADVVAMFTYTMRGFTWDLGYDFWGRSREKISLSDSDNNNPFPANWALKGDASVFGATNNPATTFVRLAATESKATIHAGTNGTVNVPPLFIDQINPNIDSPTPAFATNPGVAMPVPVFVITTTIPINTSNPPVLITINSLDTESAETRAITNKIFTHFNYTWIDREDWIPYLGLGVEGEFGNNSSNNNNNNNTTTTTTNNNTEHVKCGLSKWAIFVKLGVSFD